MQRFLAGLIALFGLGLSVYNAAVFPSGGTIGMTVQERGGVVYALVQPGGPAAHAGIAGGDAIEYSRASFDARIAASGLVPKAGAVYRYPVVHDGERRIVAIVAARSGTNSRYGLLADLALAILYVTFCLLVIAKAAPSAISTLLAWLLATFALQNAVSDYQFTAPTLDAVFWSYIAQLITVAAVQALMIAIVCNLPVGTPPLRRRLLSFIPLLSLLAYGDLPALVFSVASPVFTAPAVFNTITGVSIAYDLIGGLALLWLGGTALPEDRVRVRWFISTLALFGYLTPALFGFNDAYVHDSLVEKITLYASSFALIGPVYATLRHQLVDLDVVLSRSAVYGIISLAIVLIFLALEWLANTVAEAQVDERWSGVASLLSFAIALVIGLSMRPLHTGVESAVNAVVFRDRLRKLRLLESFATESDLIESRAVLLELTFAAARDSLETADIAIYVGDGERYGRVHATNEAIPARLDRSDRLVLQLLQRTGPFVSHVDGFTDWLIVPLRVRTETVGFIACGRKRDHTAYLSDEEDALDRVSHHVATSYALLRENS